MAAALVASILFWLICVVAIAFGVGTVLEHVFGVDLPVEVPGSLPASPFWLVAVIAGFLGSRLGIYAETGEWERPAESVAERR